MIRRFPMSFRSQAYNEADFYKLTPVARKIVAPGESISSFVIDARFVSAVFDKVKTTPVLAQVWLFYVPHRLVWADWMDFIALSDTITTVPTTTVAWPQMFEPGNTVKSALCRRSYKAIYNAYFGDETVGQANGAWYDNPADDSVVSLNRLLAWDQARSSLANRGSYTESSFSATVTAGVASIPLDQFARALRDNTARRRQKVTGDKYVDTMRLMGVELDWKIQNVPEYLGSGQTVLHARERAGSGDATSLATRVCEWSGKLSINQKKRVAFAEHGYVLALAGFRPAYMVADSTQIDTNLVDKSGFFRPDADTIMDPTASSLRERYMQYLKGFNVIGSNQNGNVFNVPNTGAVFYPDPADYVVASGSGPRHMSFTADVSIRGLTPAASGRA